MDIKKIRALLTAVELGSLTSAAEELGYTQSGLTHMMNSLEEELGLNLLVRSKKGVEFSPAAQEILPQMQAMIEAEDVLMAAAQALHEKNISKIRLGAYSSMARQWLPTVLADFRSANPDTDIEMYVGGIPDIYEKLKKDELDCAFVSLQDSMVQGLKYIQLRDDPLVAILPGNFSAAMETFPVNRFAGAEFIMPGDGFENDILPALNVNLEKITSRIYRINLDDAALVSMVEHKLGVTILSELVMQGMNYNVRTLPLEPAVSRHLGIAVNEKKAGDKSIRRFIKCAHAAIDRMYEKYE